jgi:hypothetical protein
MTETRKLAAILAADVVSYLRWHDTTCRTIVGMRSGSLEWITRLSRNCHCAVERESIRRSGRTRGGAEPAHKNRCPADRA